MDDKIYELMAQAEILQEHALELQNKASEAIFEIPEAIDQAKKKIRSTALWGAVVWLIFGIAIFFAIWFAFKWSTELLREEKNSLKWEISDLQGKVEKLRKEIQSEEKRLAEVQTWGIELREDKGKRFIRLGKGDQFGQTGNWTDGRAGIEVIRKK